MSDLPVIAIVGRPNVGKSALFNRISGKQISLVYDRPGVTRDRLETLCQWDSKAFSLVDTGGVGLDDDSGFEEAIQREVQIAIATAGKIALVVDGRAGLHVLDHEIARTLRKKNQSVTVVVNKLDSQVQDNWDAEFLKLGFPDVFPISAAHGIGIHELLAHLTRDFPMTENEPETAPQAPTTRLAIVGRPNAGKSSLINALTKSNRLITSPTAGTTRDAVDIPFQYKGQDFVIVDTAGMRKKNRVKDPLEQAMTGRSAHTINRAHIVTLVIDAIEGPGEQEKKIAGLIQEAHKPCILLVNKWDLTLDTKAKELGGTRSKAFQAFKTEYKTSLQQQLFFLDYAPVIFTSALKQIAIDEWLKTVTQILENRHIRIGTGQLNRILNQAIERQTPPLIKGKRFKIYYATQHPEKREIPAILAFVNDRNHLTESYQRYLTQQVRNHYPAEGCPILWEYRNKQETGNSKKKRS